MAGAGYKLFNTGDVLTAAQVNTYLMEQTVMVFADAAARTTALTGVVSEGMISYLKDTNAVEVYNGSAWVSSDDPNAIQNTIVDAKGDLITATAADTPSRLAVGNSGETLVADSSATTGLRWQGNFAAGKNAIINGDFSIWQRGAGAFTTNNYSADRWTFYGQGSGTSHSATRETFTSGSAPVSGYESQYFYRDVIVSGSDANTQMIVIQKIEDVRKFASQTVTVSFWAKANSGTPKIGMEFYQDFGSGGSGAVTGTGQSVTISTTWARYSATFSVPSISGKTVGTGSALFLNLWLSAGSNAATRSGSVGLQSATFDIWGVQVEAGNVATAFQTATGTLAGELAACQRYYEKSYDVATALGTAEEVMAIWGNANSADLTLISGAVQFKVTKRATPTITIYNTATGATGTFVAGATTMTVSSTVPSQNGIGRIYTTANMTAGTYTRFHYTASSEL